MADITVVMDKLHDFETADDMAEFFRVYGIKAQPQDGRACAITKFVIEETGLSDVMTGTKVIKLYSKDVLGLERVTKTFKLSPAMERFVDKYDKGHYPDLVEEGYEVRTCLEKCCNEID